MDRKPSPSYHLTVLIGGRGRERGGYLPETLLDLADRLRRLAPSTRDPNHFHEEKSEIAHELRKLAKETTNV